MAHFFSLLPEWWFWLNGIGFGAIGLGMVLGLTASDMSDDHGLDLLGLVLIFGGLFAVAPTILYAAALVMYGPVIILVKAIGVGWIVLAALIAVVGWVVYEGFIKPARDTASNIGEGKLKKCSTCGKLKPIEDFKDPNLKSGIGRKCLACKFPI